MKKIIIIIFIIILICGCIKNNDIKNNDEEKKIYDSYEIRIIVNNFDNYSILLPVLPFSIKNTDDILSNISTTLKKSDINIITIYNVTEINVIAQKVIRINFSRNFTLKYKLEIEEYTDHGYLSLYKGVDGWKEYYWVHLDYPNNYSVQLKLNTSVANTEPEYQIIKKGWTNIITRGPGRE